MSQHSSANDDNRSCSNKASNQNGTSINTQDTVEVETIGQSVGANSDDDVKFVDVYLDLCTSPSTSAAAARTANMVSLCRNEAKNVGSDRATTSKQICAETRDDSDNDDADAAAGAALNSKSPLECPICLQSCIHPARLPCGHIFCFLCVKGVAYKNRRCAMCRREIPPEFLDHPQLVNGINDICTTKATEDGYQWYYEGRNGWWQYDDRTSQDIEDAFKKGDKSCTVLVAGYVYIVDLDAMVQQRQNEPARSRRVKRDLATIPKKGVAGLRIEGNTVTTDSNFTLHVYQQQQRQQQFALQTYSQTNYLAQQQAYTSNSSGDSDRMSLLHPNNLMSTIAVTDAAIRFASDIMGSSLTHADELTRGLSASSGDLTRTTSGEHATTPTDNLSNLILNEMAIAHSSSSNDTSSNDFNSIQGIMRSTSEDLVDTTQQVIESNQRSIDLYELALNEFQELSLQNAMDESSANEEEEDEEEEHNESQILNRNLRLNRRRRISETSFDGNSRNSNF